jgi:hypothetical protein
MGAAKALQTHIDQINTSLGGKARLPTVPADFAGAIKGKKSISSLRDAADSELARAKIAASQIGDSIRANLASYDELAASHTFLFNDLQQLVLKANDDLVALIKVRISEHQKVEADKEEAQRERIRKEELRRIEDESKPAIEAASAQTAPTPPVVKSAPAVATIAKSAVATAKPMTYRAEVTDLEALVHAVAGGLAPLSVLTVNWDALDTLVAQRGSLFSMAGVTLVNAAA